MSTIGPDDADRQRLTPDLLVQAYRSGYFPMAESRDGPIYWLSPDPRAIIPLDGFHIPRGLRRRLRKNTYHITRNQAFETVIRQCAAPAPDREETWINDDIIHAYCGLHARGLACSVEAWRRDEAGEPDELVGGLYGVCIGGAYFGESMFSRATDASKVCLVHLVEHMRARGMVLLDVQFVNDHLRQFGVIEISREAYLRKLRAATALRISW